MKKQLMLHLFGLELCVILRDNRKSRFEDIIIDAGQKQKMLDSLDIEALKQKAQAMRAIHIKD